eukprot:9003093-Alexandrium_andersonii.AAC.1
MVSPTPTISRSQRMQSRSMFWGARPLAPSDAKWRLQSDEGPRNACHGLGCRRIAQAQQKRRGCPHEAVCEAGGRQQLRC